MKLLLSLSISGLILAGCSSYTSSYSPSAGQAAYGAPASSQTGRFGVGLSAGTTGATIEAKYAPSEAFMLRGNFNYLDFSRDEEFDGIDYEGDLNVSTFGGFADIAPFRNGFVISGGAYFGDKTLDLVATPNGNVEIGGQTFTPAEVGTLTGEAKLKNFAPYAGIGYDSFMSGSSNWSFNARAGVMFTGSPEAELISANGTLSGNPLLLNELELEVQALEDDAEDFKYYPVVTVGVARRF